MMQRPTTAEQVQAWLVEKGLYPYYAAADGKEPYDGYALAPRGNGWVVFRCAPMTATNERHFNDEQMAVEEFLERMRFGGFAEALKDFEPRRRILVMDYSLDLARPLARLLHLAGFDTVPVETLSAAHEAAEAGRFDVLISRVWMKDGDPKEFMQRLLAVGTKGIATGGMRTEEELAALRAAGFEEYLEMPIDFQRLRDVVGRMVRTRM